MTKRFILSRVAQIFDPLGLVGPIIVRAKLFIQRLWQTKLEWDEAISGTLLADWNCFSSELNSLNDIAVVRRVLASNDLIKSESLEIHGFCDASEQAYGACIYLRYCTSNGTYKFNLLCAKSRVSPIKVITLPRLELCGALLLAKLYGVVSKALNIIHIKQSFFWTDSQIVLSWIQSPSHQFKIFVGNRISKIQETTTPGDWYFIRGDSNPADIISRGCSPSDLAANHLWWHGPLWFRLPQDEWPDHVFCNRKTDLPEMKANVVSNVSLRISNSIDLFKKFSSLTKLTRVYAFILRFCKNSRTKPDSRIFGCLTSEELLNSQALLIKLCQGSVFTRELKDLRERGNVQTNSSLLCLNPFLSEDGFIRVGGRLRNAKVSY